MSAQETARSIADRPGFNLAINELARAYLELLERERQHLDFIGHFLVGPPTAEDYAEARRLIEEYEASEGRKTE